MHCTYTLAAGDAESTVTRRVSLLASVDLPKTGQRESAVGSNYVSSESMESDYFGLRFMNSAQVAHWLDGTKSRQKVVHPVVFIFKFYFLEPDNQIIFMKS